MTSIHTDTLRRVHLSLAAVAVTLAALVAALVVVVFGGVIEGRMRPVVGPLYIDSVQAVGDGVEIAGRFERHRDCGFVRLEWWVGSPNAGTQAAVAFPRAIDRSVGWQEFAGWRLSIPPGALLISSPVAVHRCHGLFETRTPMRIITTQE